MMQSRKLRKLLEYLLQLCKTGYYFLFSHNGIIVGTP
jgi:hypothetical protein